MASEQRSSVSSPTKDMWPIDGLVVNVSRVARTRTAPPAWERCFAPGLRACHGGGLWGMHGGALECVDRRRGDLSHGRGRDRRWLAFGKLPCL